MRSLASIAYLILFYAWGGSADPGPRPPPPPVKIQPTTFHITSGSNDNYFFRDNATTAQILVTNSTTATPTTTRRLVVALPAGNNGALAYFIPSTSSNASSNLDIQLVNGSIQSTSESFNNKGIQADLRFSGNATLGVTIVGAVRALRDYVEGSGTMHEIFNYTLLSHSSTEVRLHRQYINSTASPSALPNPNTSSTRVPPSTHSPTPQKLFKSVDLYFSVPSGSAARLSVTPSTNGSFTPPKIDVVIPSRGQPRPAAADNHVRFRVLTNESSLAALETKELFLPVKEATTSTLQNVLGGLPQGVADQVSFLTFQDKFTAGGWRFLTYFGRDSMIALRMLMPILSTDGIEAALSAVIERANSTGALCHEETIGDYASFININNNQSDLGNTPFYDYKMIDTDLLLLPAMAHYFLDLPQGKNRSSDFLSKQASLQNGSYADIVNRIASYNINRALPLFRSTSPNHNDLLAFRPGQPVGNWRDSNQGTGYGTIPFDVNSALVPASLRAVESLLDAGVLSYNDLQIGGSPAQPIDIGEVAKKWEEVVPSMFEVQVDPSDAQNRLASFIQEEGLDPQLLNPNSSTTTASPSNSTQNVTFYALSLMADGTPVEVLNSDLGFNLMYGTNVSATFLERVADALVPFPRGLLTNIGMVVANPAYDSNRTNVQVLDRTAYHGTVVWSFQQALMAGGLARQLGFCNSSLTPAVDLNEAPVPKPDWCESSDLVQRLQDAQRQLWNSIGGASQNIYSEVWSWSFNNSTKTFSTADLATLSPEGTESDAIQLWSYGFLGLISPQT